MSIPAGATHVVADIHGLSDSGKSMNEGYPYRKKDSAGWSAYVEGEWVGVVFGDPSRYQKIDKQWSGPQDGLPPVGTVCECTVKANDHWVPCEIVAHHGRFAIGYVDENTVMLSAGIRFRYPEAIKKLAAEQRETAIREIMDIADVDCRVTAARLVDAGFKR